jgi:hypothetical protein
VWRPDVAPPAVPGAVVRLANFALPVTKNTYAAEVADDLRPGHVLVSLVELDPALADRGLYARRERPRRDRRPGPTRACRLRVPDDSGCSGSSPPRRAFSLYVMAREDPLEHAARDERQPPVARGGCGMSAAA